MPLKENMQLESVSACRVCHCVSLCLSKLTSIPLCVAVCMAVCLCVCLSVHLSVCGRTNANSCRSMSLLRRTTAVDDIQNCLSSLPTACRPQGFIVWCRVASTISRCCARESGGKDNLSSTRLALASHLIHAAAIKPCLGRFRVHVHIVSVNLLCILHPLCLLSLGCHPAARGNCRPFARRYP